MPANTPTWFVHQQTDLAGPADQDQFEVVAMHAFALTAAIHVNNVLHLLSNNSINQRRIDSEIFDFLKHHHTAIVGVAQDLVQHTGCHRDGRSAQSGRAGQSECSQMFGQDFQRPLAGGIQTEDQADQVDSLWANDDGTGFSAPLVEVDLCGNRPKLCRRVAAFDFLAQYF